MSSGPPSQALRSPTYTLTSDIAQLCLPAASRDENKRLAWANSVCILFLVVGFIGVKPPKLVEKTLEPEPVEVAPVIFTPPSEPPPTVQEPQPDQEPPPPDLMVDAPQVVTVVAANPAAVAFPVPVEGPVMVAASPRFATPPPATPPRPTPLPTGPPKPVTFRPSTTDGGFYPQPPYPREALTAGIQGTVVLYVIVSEAGEASSVEVQDSSGSAKLDRPTLDYVKRRWRWPAGPVRHYLVPVEYRVMR